MQKAYEQSGGILCHHCANDFDLGAPVRAIVYESGEQVCDDDHNLQVIAELKQQRDKLLAALEPFALRGEISAKLIADAKAAITSVKSE